MNCLECGLSPEELSEYASPAAEEQMTPAEYVRTQEGTFNSTTDKFWCTPCYIKIGMPLGVAR